MSIVNYKCDVCKREIELQRNIHGLETPGRCIITHGCRGKLVFKELLQDFQRGTASASVVGLDNWQQRNVLFDYEQAIERDEWTIEHNLGNSVSVSVFVNRPTEDDPDRLDEIEPDDIIIVSSDIIKLKFSRAYAGIAQLIARASDPQLLQPKIAEVMDVAVAQQLSNLSVMSIATLSTETNIGLELTYTTPQETTVVNTYIVDNQPSIESSWVDVDRVIINNQIYTVRSFNGIFPDIPAIVGNGSTFRFTAIDDNNDTNFRDLVEEEVFFLLAAAPFSTVDRIVDQVIDVSEVTATTNPFAFAYDSSEFFATTNTIQTVYPHVRET